MSFNEKNSLMAGKKRKEIRFWLAEVELPDGGSRRPLGCSNCWQGVEETPKFVSRQNKK
jgi:hypothetical protein